MSEAAGFSDPKAANYLSYSLIIFTVSRFISTALLTVFSAPFLLMVCAALCALFTALMGSLDGIGGVACLMATYAVMAIQYPVIFVISTEGLGRHTRSAAGLLVQGVAGGAVFPPIQGAIADHFGTKKSMWLSFPAFLYIVGFAYWRVSICSLSVPRGIALFLTLLSSSSSFNPSGLPRAAISPAPPRRPTRLSSLVDSVLPLLLRPSASRPATARRRSLRPRSSTSTTKPLRFMFYVVLLFLIIFRGSTVSCFSVCFTLDFFLPFPPLLSV